MDAAGCYHLVPHRCNTGINIACDDLVPHRCNTGINIAWLGTDVQQSAFTTGPQIQRLNSLSIVSLYYTVKDYVVSTVRDAVR